MITYGKENNGFIQLLRYVHRNEDAEYLLVYKGAKRKALYITDFETDNGLDLDEEGYEEFNAINFEDVETGEQLVVDYHCLPDEVWCNGERII